MNKFLIFSFFVIILSLSWAAAASAQLEITAPDELFVVAKYDFEANNPENFETPYYWWGIYDIEEKKFLPKYFQKDIIEEEALNNNKLEDVVFLEGDKWYWVGVVYCPVFIDEPLNLQEIETNGCSYKIKPINVKELHLWGTIKEQYKETVLQWIWKIKEYKPLGLFPKLFYNWGVYSYDLGKIIDIQTHYHSYSPDLELGKYIVGAVVCNYVIEIDEDKPLENFDSENCIILTRNFEVVENIHAEPLIFQAGENILIKGGIRVDDETPQFDRVEVEITRHIGNKLVEEIDQIKLFDDGEHGDGEVGDGIYGNYWNSLFEEISLYKLKYNLYSNNVIVGFGWGNEFYIIASPDECLTILDNGPIEDTLDILFVGESFETVDDLLELINIQQEYFIGEYGIEPYKFNKEKINLHVSTYLLQDLCEDGFCKFDPSNYLHCPYDKVIYFTRGLSYGGGYATLGGVWAVVRLPTVSEDDINTAITVHEFGHSFGSLRDEYGDYGDYPNWPGQPNCAVSTEEAMNWWGDKVGQAVGNLQVLSPSELSIVGKGITWSEFISKYGGYLLGTIEYNKCTKDLDDCINKEDFLGISDLLGPGCGYSDDNFRPSLQSIMISSRTSLTDFIHGQEPFKDYYWWNHWHGPVNEAHLETLLGEYS